MNAAEKQVFMHYDPVQLLGVIRGRQENGSYVVDCDGYEWQVLRAASCLLEPMPGDTVLISGPDPQQCYLIAVITQAQIEQSHLRFAGDVHLVSEKGSVVLHAEQDLALQGGQQLSLDSASLRLNTQQANCAVQDMNYMGSKVKASVARLSFVGKVYEAVLDRMTHIASHIFRHAEQVEHVRARHQDCEVESVMRLKAGQALITGKELVKVDGDQIHMG